MAKLIYFRSSLTLKNYLKCIVVENSCETSERQCLMPIILATWEAEIRRVTVWSQPGQIVFETLSWKNPSQKRAGGVAQGVDPEFKPQSQKTNNNKKLSRSIVVKNANSYLYFLFSNSHSSVIVSRLVNMFLDIFQCVFLIVFLIHSIGWTHTITVCNFVM
jgi:hypothetical protein